MQKIKALILILSVIIQPVLAWNTGNCNSDSSDTGGTAKACATVSHSQDGECVKSAASINVKGETIASVNYSGSDTINVQTSSTGSGIVNVSAGGNHSSSGWAKGHNYQKTTAYGYWSTYSMAWGGNPSASAGYTASWTGENIDIDSYSPNSCVGTINSGVVTGPNGVYACPGKVSVTWSGQDVGCAGFNVVNSSYNATDGKATANACDNFGNCNPICSINWNVDCEKPVCSSSSITQSEWGWTKGSVVVDASCTDAGVGMQSDHCKEQTATKEDETVTLSCKDRLGNTSYISHKVTNIDISAPYCTGWGVTKPSAGIYARTAIPAWGSCGDARSGCTAGTYYADIAGGSGTIGLSDNVGNTGVCNISYDFWDGSKPTTKITFDSKHTGNSESQYTTDDKITVTISATDSGKAGVDRVCYKLEGTTTQNAVCHKGSSYSFDITNEGVTKITAWSFDKAYDYSGGYVYNASTTAGGNRSDDVSKSAYIDRTKPNLTVYSADDDGVVTDAEVNMSLTSPYDSIKDTTPWVDTPIIVTVDSFDTKYRDNSSSGLGSVEYYWGLTANPAEVWGSAHMNRKFNTNNQPTETIPTKALAGTVYGANEVQYENRDNYKPSFSNPANNTVLNDELYLHVRVCDRATTVYGQKAPNCTTAVYGPVYYDDMPPNIVTPVVPPEDKTPVNPSTDPDDPTKDPETPVGGTGSEIVDPDDIPADATAMNSHDWTNRLVIGFVAYEHMQNSEVNIGSYKKNSGIDKIEFYYDRSYNHEPTTLDKSVFTVLDNYRNNCEEEKVCAYYLDFNSLSNYPDNGSYTTMEEGNRFIKVRVHDIAGNYKDFYFGPYKFDITPNKISNITFSGQAGTMIDK